MAEFRHYEVQPGDTLSEIARDHDVANWRDIVKANPSVIIDGDPRTMQPGNILHIPDADIVEPPPPPPPPPVDPPPSADVEIEVGENIQQAVNGHPEGTSFLLQAGVHNQQVNPKTGQIFIGEPGAILDGQNSIPYAFYGPVEDNIVTNVEIHNLLIRDYVPFLDHEGAVQAHHQRGWKLINTEIMGSGFSGAYLGDHALIQNCNIHHNHRVGIKISGGGAITEDTELAYNNFEDRNDPLWDVAGIKMAWELEGAAGNIVRRCYVHHNHGAGIWWDISNDNGLAADNIVEDNTHNGIVTEISDGTVIRNNKTRRNGFGMAHIGWAWGNGIQVQSASNVEIYDNFSEDDHNGIMLVQMASRGHPLQNVLTRNNQVFNPAHWAAGATEGYGIPFDEQNYQFTNNSYFDADTWRWGDNSISYAQWQGLGNDT